MVAGWLYMQGYWDGVLGGRAVLEGPPAAGEPAPRASDRAQPRASAPAASEPQALPRARKAEPAAVEGSLSGIAARRRAYGDAVRVFNSGDYRKALDLFEDLAPDDRKALVGLGLSKFKLGDYQGAIESLEGSLGQGGEEDFLARKFLAFSYYQEDDLQRSLRYAQEGLGLRRDPELQSLYDRLRRETAAERDYIEEETLHFKVLFDGYAHGGLSRKVISILNDAYRTIGGSLNYFPDRPVTVILYTERDFFDITRASGWAGGLYDGKIRVPVRSVEGREEALRRVLFHEYAHSLVYSITPRCPRWVNEGLAEYFSGAQRSRGRGHEMPLSSLESSFPATRLAAAAAYGESHRAVSYLIDRYGLYAMKDFLVRLGRGEGRDRAFSSAFMVSYGEFLSEWDGI
jgi:tetratricopeptide (TPR) repeat protein